MRILLDTSLLVEGERRNFDLGNWVAAARRAGKTVPLGDGLHAAVAELEDLTVATVDLDHFKVLGVRAVNPLK